MPFHALIHMTQDQIHILRIILESGSFARASVILGLEPSTLSKSVHRLESKLGVSILTRHGKGIAPTRAGNVLLEQVSLLTDQSRIAYELIRHAQDASSTAPPPTEDRQTRLKVAIASELSELLLGTVFAALKRAKFADIEIAVHSGANLEELVIAGRIDIGLVCDPPLRAELVAKKLTEETMVIVHAPNLTVEADKILPRLHALGDTPMLLPSWDHSTRRIIEQNARRAGLTFRAVAEIADFGGLKSLLRQSLGYTIMPYCAVSQDAERGHLCVIPLQGLGQTIAISSIGRPAAQSRPEIATGQTILADCLADAAASARARAPHVYRGR